MALALLPTPRAALAAIALVTVVACAAPAGRPPSESATAAPAAVPARPSPPLPVASGAFVPPFASGVARPSFTGGAAPAASGAAPAGGATAAPPVTVAPQATPEPPPTPVDVLISVEDTDCPLGGPIYRWAGGKLSVLAQGGLLKKPRDGKLDGKGNLIIADGQVGLMRVSLATGAVSLIAGGPPWQPRDVIIEPSGSFVVVDTPVSTTGTPTHPGFGPALYRITQTGQVSKIAEGAPLSYPHGLSQDAAGNFIVADVQAGVIRVSPQGQMTAVASVRGSDVIVDRDGNYVVANAGVTGVLARVTPSGQTSFIHSGAPFSPNTSTGGVGPGGGPRSVTLDAAGNYVLLDSLSATVFQVTRSGAVFTMFHDPVLCHPAGVIVLQ